MYSVPGVVGGVEGHCSVVVWDRPREPNGIIANYTILFFLNVGNDSGVVMETDSDITHFEIESLHQLPLIPQGGSPFVKVCTTQVLSEFAYLNSEFRYS